MRSARIELILDTLRSVRNAKLLSRATDEAADCLDDAAKAGDRAGRAIDDAGDQMSDAARAAAKLDREIEQLTGSLREMALAQALTGDNFSKQIREQETQVRRLTKNRKLLGDFGSAGGEDAAVGFATRFSSRLGPLVASGPGLGIAGAGIGLALAPTAASALAAGIIGSATAGGIIGGVTVAARDPAVKLAGTALGNFLLADLESRAAGFVPPVLGGIERIRKGWVAMGPDLDRVFESSRFVEPLVEGAVAGAKSVVRGFADAVDQAGPVMQSLTNLMSEMGDAVGDTFTLLADDAQEGASAISDLTMAMSNAVRTTGHIVHGLAEVKGWIDDVDKRADRFRYQLESWGFALDLTADGFKVGSREAEAYERATIGTAKAADFATLKAAGMSGAQISAADASGHYREELEKLEFAAIAGSAAADSYRRAMDGTAISADFAALKTAGLTEEQIKQIDESGRYDKELKEVQTATLAAAEAQETARRAALGHRDALDELSNAMRAQFDPVFALKQAQDQFKVAQDKANEAVRRHGEGSKQARAANLELASAAINLQGKVGALGATFNGELTPQMHATLTAAGLTEEQIKDVAGQFRDAKKAGDAYAKNYAASASLTGFKDVWGDLSKLSAMQYALKFGVSLSAARAHQGDARAAKGRNMHYAGGWTGPGATMDEAGIVHADEHVIKKSSRRQLEAARPGGLDYMNETGRWPGYDRGGRVVWPYPTTAAMTRVPSRQEAMAVVIPAVPTGTTAPWMERLLESRFGVKMISGFRRGSRTLSGNLSYHALNRAVDFAAIKSMAKFMHDNYMSRLKEAITPWQQYNIHNGRPHRYTGAVWNQHNFAGGNAHNHFAMAGGGTIREPVFGYGMRSGNTYSLGERGPERVLPAGASGVSVTNNITINGAHHNIQQIADEVSRRVGRTIDVYVRGNG